jgi:hypothetical protein
MTIEKLSLSIESINICLTRTTPILASHREIN